MKNFKPNLIKAALITSGFAFGISPALAQEAAVGADDETEVIQVTGIRGSLQKAQAIKMDNTSIVEVITAEDIGKLPDSSIAESLARLPGLAAQRLDGRASSISIRGLGENFSSTTFNGREQVSLGDNRGVEFDVYPSEIMNEVVVYKTPDATLMNQGIGGTIDMRTVKPLSFGKQAFGISLRGEKNDIGALNPDKSDTGWRGSLSYIDQFKDDTIGVALAYAHMDSPINEERYNTWGWPGGDDGAQIGGLKPFVRSAELKRDTIMGVVQFIPSDNLQVNIDALYIDFTDDQDLRGPEIPAAWGDAGITGTTFADGYVQTGTIGSAGSPVGVVIRNDVTIREADLTAIGLNVDYDINDSWSLNVDAAYSETERRTWSLESYAGTGRGGDDRLPETIDFAFNSDNTGVALTPDLDYGDPSVIQLSNPQNWGWGNLIDPDPSVETDQDGFINTPIVEDELTTLKFAAKKITESGIISSVEFGAYYSDRTKSKVDTGVFLTLPQALDANGSIIPGFQLPVPEQYRLANVNLDFIGFGDMVAYDSFQFWQDGNYTEFDSRLTDPARWQNTWDVTEEVTTLFVKADIETEVGGLPLRGNVGFQYVDTDQSSNGFGARRLDDRTLDVQATSGGTTYSEFLPSLNLILDVADEQVVRLGLAKTMSRSRMDRMNASSGELSFSNQTGIWSGSIANSELRPIKSNQIDLSYENYFHDEGYFSISLFYKELTDWQLNVPSLVDTSDLTPPAGFESAPFGVLTQWQNVGEGKVQGSEFTLSLPGVMFSDALDGLGAIFSATFLDSELDFDLELPNADGTTSSQNFNITVPGLSKEVFNATVYYERNGFEFRVSMRQRDDFLGEVSGLSLVRVPVNVKGSSLVDAQISYDFDESGIDALAGLSLTLQAQNLTDEEFITYHTFERSPEVRDNQRFGKNFLFGLNYQF
jgi:iron complex outermembrane receptor protein